MSPELFDEMEETWAPVDDPVFKLVPDSFETQASAFYQKIQSDMQTEMGEPVVLGIDNFWFFYSALLTAFENSVIDATFTSDLEGADDHFEFDIDLLSGQKELRNGDDLVGDLRGYIYCGGLANPPPKPPQDNEEESDGDHREFGDFTDDEPEHDAY